ncbi:TlpA family protein disulfide reductase [Streptomyces sp. MMG1121]|uniref:TlpA family protein disulfide reductase n=1 Tax=Streptomyces sp. MMG1121 TaxID=1415544 RepID=UPI00131E50C9|nr:TlpA disulfide reductase family protein [Streptomyces sp. MMG1121]
MKKRAVLSIAVCLAAVSACQASPGEKIEPGQPIPAAQRQAAPDLEGASLDGARLRLADYRGKVVVLNGWASWCGPCRAEAPELTAAQKHLAAKGVQFFGLNTDADSASGRAFQKEHGLPYPSLADPGGKHVLKFPRETVPLTGIPFTLVIDRSGHIAAVNPGTITEREVTDMVTPLIGGRTASR